MALRDRLFCRGRRRRRARGQQAERLVVQAAIGGQNVPSSPGGRPAKSVRRPPASSTRIFTAPSPRSSGRARRRARPCPRRPGSSRSSRRSRACARWRRRGGRSRPSAGLPEQAQARVQHQRVAHPRDARTRGGARRPAKAPSPVRAVSRARRVTGLKTTPVVISPCSSSRSAPPRSGCARTKFWVPSIGSMIHRAVGRSPPAPNSSPRRPQSGKRAPEDRADGLLGLAVGLGDRRLVRLDRHLEAAVVVPESDLAGRARSLHCGRHRRMQAGHVPLAPLLQDLLEHARGLSTTTGMPP